MTKFSFLVVAILAAVLSLVQVQCYPSPAAAAVADEQLRRMAAPGSPINAASTVGGQQPPLPAGVAGPNQETLKGESSYGYGYAYPYYGYYYPRYYAYGYGYPYYSSYYSHWGWPYYR
ncbi:uncharacterized protein LOC135839061 [Planococcus citri]|uniref:uncharacterized protein LOC135839061 n=1 Tax=Planococcus citri TaxID=170843 RepID=UPI0031F864CC